MSDLDLTDVVGAPKTNGLAIAGFICSLLGLLGGVILCPVGLVISIIAMGREPKGFAIAGVIIGLIGSCGWIIVFVLVGGAILAFLGMAVAVAVSEPERLEISGESIILEVLLAEARNRGDLPETLDGLAVDSSQLLDPWGNPYRYSLVEDGTDFTIFSDGPDGTEHTGDDIDLRNLSDLWKGDRPRTEIRSVGPTPPTAPDPPFWQEQ